MWESLVDATSQMDGVGKVVLEELIDQVVLHPSHGWHMHGL
jgi:hypothetical protein